VAHAVRGRASLLVLGKGESALSLGLAPGPRRSPICAERYSIVADQVTDVDFSRQLELMEKAVNLVLKMVQALRAGRNLGIIKSLQNELQAAEAEADDVLLEMEREFYKPGFPALKAVILKDLFSLNEKVVDRCRDAGNVVSNVLLKNS
jgi:uncharacterized protein Yka (UPF0111/DUF47 family)